MVELRIVLQFIGTASAFSLITHIGMAMYEKWMREKRDDSEKNRSVVRKSVTRIKSGVQKNEKSISEVIFINEETYACSDIHKNNNDDDSDSDGEDKISEVIFSNEMTYKCTNEHKRRPNFLKIPKNPNEESRWMSLTEKCQNPHCATKNLNRLLAFIDKAQYSIDVAMYTLTQNELSSALIRATKRGVEVRILTDKNMKLMFNAELQKGLIQLRFNKGALIMHHKFVIIDGKLRIEYLKSNRNLKPNDYQSIVLSGSLNWTNQGTTANYENCFITSNKNFVQKYEEEFERMWNIFAIKAHEDLKK